MPLKFEQRPTASLRPSPRNARLHSEEQISKICASIKAYGFNNPCLVDSSGELIAGEGRWRAARRLGLAEVPVVVLDHLSARERDAYCIADNRIAEDSTWDEELLSKVLRDLEMVTFDFAPIGFDLDEVTRLLDPASIEANAPPNLDVAEPLPIEPTTQLGDIWVLGEHRLICGDATDLETLRGLFHFGERARLIVTDPPYGMGYGGGRAAGSSPVGARVKAHGPILNDDASGPSLTALIRVSLENARAFATKGAAFYIALTWRTYSEFREAVESAGLKISSCIVWDKGSIGLGNQRYRPRHEFIFFCSGDVWNGGADQADLWEFSRGATAQYVHPTQKPVSLIERAITHSSLRGHLVLDPFAGSGSTIIACERLQRTARLVELDPRYCDAIVHRWEKFTGRAAERIPGGRGGPVASATLTNGTLTPPASGSSDAA